jgi:choice-of-anchor B domain-containing protein
MADGRPTSGRRPALRQRRVHALIMRASLLPVLLALPAMALAHGESGIRYLSPAGIDAGSCEDPHDACRTLAYAAVRIGKIGEVRVAAGVYHIDELDELYFVATRAHDLAGGYSPDFQRRDPAQYATTLVGVPAQRRQELEARGFEVITDNKWDGTGIGADPQLLAALTEPMLTSSGPASCTGGSAAGFSCSNVDLLAQIALADFSSNPAGLNDIWGFVDFNTDREYALVGLLNGVAVVDVTDPTAPFEVGTVGGQQTVWRDLKVLQIYDEAAGRWRAYGYVSADAAQDHLTIIDFSGLPNRVELLTRTTPDRSAHTLSVTGVDLALNIPLPDREPLLIQAGSNLNRGAFRAFSLTDPAAPVLIMESPFGYMHDSTAMVLHDPSQVAHCPSASSVCEVLADFNETTLDLWDITLPSNPAQLSSTTYTDASYVHSGSWSEDGRYIFLHDEGDELSRGVNTTVYVFDASDLATPQLAGSWVGSTPAVDHNGYPRGNRYYLSNYARGLTVLDITNSAAPLEVGFFDTYPISDAGGFPGAWGVYPLLPSRTVLVSDRQSGLFVLADRTRDRPQGTFAFARRSFAGVKGTRIELAVARSGGSSGAVSVGWEVLPGGAAAEIAAGRGRLEWISSDDLPRHIEIDIPASATSSTSLRRFFVRLFDPIGGATLGDMAIASVFVQEPGATATVAFAEEPTVPRSLGRTLVVVQRGASAAGEVEVDFATVPGSAQEGTDYTPVSGTLGWADGDATARVIEIPLTPAQGRPERQLTVLLSNAQGATIMVGTATVTIEATAAPPPPPPPPAPAPAPPRSGGGGAVGILWCVAVGLLLWGRRRLS